MKIHFIAIGGSAMHNLALALHKKKYDITGSDDTIYNPAKNRLKKAGIFPKKVGWYPEKINKKINAVILGMHAKSNNPELLKAQKLGIKIYSYPEYIYEQSKDKTRVVISGSHGKTTITSMILHVLKLCEIKFDFMVGAQLEGFSTMVQLTNAPIIILEGDEYLSSAIDRQPKFMHYKPKIALITGIAWDHVNVFPSFEKYVNQFKKLIKAIKQDGSIIYYEKDNILNDLVSKNTSNKTKIISYSAPEYKILNNKVILSNNKTTINIFGKHNLENLSGAKKVCSALGVSDKDFYTSIKSFSGASNRLELIGKYKNLTIYKDFAHSPSKVKATVDAVKEQHKDKRLIACFELYTFSSLNKQFLSQYNKTLNKSDKAIVYFNPKNIEKKQLPKFSLSKVEKVFNHHDLLVTNDTKKLIAMIKKSTKKNDVILLMSSGKFGGISLEKLVIELRKKISSL